MMATMASSVPNKTLYDPLRKRRLVIQPEELIRQKWVQAMTTELGYPKELIALEKGLKSLPQGVKTSFSRRVDIVCFAKNIHPDHALYPLLLIECKSGPLNQKALDQVMGYNHTVKAYFIAVANDREIQVGCFDKSLQNYRFYPFLPSYAELIHATQSRS
jgi:hypothetical protein